VATEGYPVTQHFSVFKNLELRYLAAARRKQISHPYISQRGFTLVEVFASILIATLFVATALEAMVIAALFKAKAQQYAEATTWIQEDLESVKNRAVQLQNTSLETDATTVDTVLNVDSAHGFAVGDILEIGTDSTNNVIGSFGTNTITLASALGTDQPKDAAVLVAIKNTSLTTAATAGHTVLNLASVVGLEVGETLKVGTDSTNNVIASISANTITLASALGTDQLNTARVVAAKKCNATSQNTGFASHLRNNLPTIASDGIVTPANNNQGSRRITGRTYLLTRYGPDANSIEPGVTSEAFERLQLKYEVKPDGGGDAIATINTEVVPDAAFQCP